MSSVTISTVISFVTKLEDDSSKLYTKLAELSVENRDLFVSFAKESRENSVLVTRTYRETVSDALETSFSFEGLDLKDYNVETMLTKDIDYAEALRTALRLEEKAINFYLDASKRSKSLLSTIPRALTAVAERRSRRKLKLESLLSQTS